MMTSALTPLWLFLSISLLTGALTSPVPEDDVGISKYQTSLPRSACHYNITDHVGRITVNTSLLISSPRCRWDFNIFDVDQVTLFFHKPFPRWRTSSSRLGIVRKWFEDSRPRIDRHYPHTQNVQENLHSLQNSGKYRNSFSKHTMLSQVTIYDYPHSDRMYTWHPELPPTALTLPLYWLYISLTVNATSRLLKSPETTFEIDYVAHPLGKDGDSCKQVEVSYLPLHGALRISNASLGSSAEVVCDKGYTARGAKAEFVCAVGDDGFLKWMPLAVPVNMTCQPSVMSIATLYRKVIRARISI